MKTKNRFAKPLIKIFTWALIVNIVFEFMFIFTSMNPFSRIGAIKIYCETWGRRNYTNTISVIPDELVGTWVIESSGSYCSSEWTKKTLLTLHPDQTFEMLYPANLLHRDFIPCIPHNSSKMEFVGEMVHLRGNWGIRVSADRHSSFDPNCTQIVGRYEGTDKYVLLGQVLDRHVSSTQNRFAIKWECEEDESHMRPAFGIYLKQNHASSQ